MRVKLAGMEMMECVQGIAYVHHTVFVIVVIANNGLKELDQRLSTGIKGREFIDNPKILICR